MASLLSKGVGGAYGAYALCSKGGHFQIRGELCTMAEA